MTVAISPLTVSTNDQAHPLDPNPFDPDPFDPDPFDPDPFDKEFP